MKRTAFGVVLLLLLAAQVQAQDQVATATLTGTTCPGAGCVPLDDVNAAGGGGIQLASLSGTVTVQFESSVDCTTWTALPAFPAAGGASVTSATGNGSWIFGAAGYCGIRARASANTGSIVATIRVSSGSQVARADSAGGGLTDAQLRATPVPVSGTVAATQSGAWNVTVANAAGAAAVNIQDGGNSITVDGPVTDGQLRATPVIGNTSAITNSGTVAALNDGVQVATATSSTATVIWPSAATLQGTITTEASHDGSAWYPIDCLWSSGAQNMVVQSGWDAQAFRNTFIQCPTAGQAHFRARVSLYTSGNALVSVHASGSGSAFTNVKVAGEVSINETSFDSNLVSVGGFTLLRNDGPPGTGSLRVTVSGAASGTAKAGNPLQTGAVFNTTQPTVTSGQVVESQATARGAQIVATGADAFTVGGVVTANAGSGTFVVSDPTFTDATGTAVPANAAVVAGTDGTNTRAIKTDVDGNLQIECLSGCGGAASFSDNTTFTFGSTAVNITGFVFDDTAPNTVTENNAAAPRMSASRVPYSNLRNSGGTEVVTATTTPGGSDLGLVVRNIPSGTQTVTDPSYTDATGSTVPANAAFVAGTDGTNTRAIKTDVDGNLQIECLAGCGGAASFADNSAFTFGSTSINITGFVFDDTAPNAVTENNAAAPRMSANRVPYSSIRDAAGNERGAGVTAHSALSVSTPELITSQVITTGGATTTLTGLDGVATVVAQDVNTGAATGTWFQDTEVSYDGSTWVAVSCFRPGAPGSWGSSGAGPGYTAYCPVSGATSFRMVTGGGSSGTITVYLRGSVGGSYVVADVLGTVTVSSGNITIDSGVVSVEPGVSPIAVTQSGGWTVTANAGTNLNTSALALDATLTGRLPAGASPADDESNTNANLSRFGAFGFVFDGTTWDRLRGDSTNGLLVNLGTNNDVTVTGTVSGTGNFTVVGAAADGAAVSGNPVRIAGKDGSGNTQDVATDTSGELQVDVLTLPSVTIGTFPDNEPFNVAQFGGTNVSTGTGAGGAGIPRVTVSNDSSVIVGSLPNEGQQTAANSISVTPDTDNDAIAANAAAPPTGRSAIAGLQSGATAGLLGSPTVCDSFANVNVSTATTTLLVTGVSGRHVRICALNMFTAGANNVALISGTGATCGTGTTGMTGGTTAGSGYNFIANQGISQGSGFGEVNRTNATGDSVCIITSAAVQLSGRIAYAIY